MMKTTAVFVILACCIYSTKSDKFSPRAPLTSIEHGLAITPPRSTYPDRVIKLEAFLDLNCPYSYDALQKLCPLAKYYEEAENVMIIIQIQVLPYHRNAMLCAQGMFAMRDLKPERELDYINATMNQWEALGVTNTRDLTEFEVLSHISQIAAESTGINPRKFEDKFGENTDGYREHVKKVFKYATKRGVAGTPAFFVNGIEVVTEDFLTFLDWTDFINGLINNMNDSLID